MSALCYIPGRRRTNSRHIGSDNNALGYDPDGRATHVSGHLFGPWTPPTVTHARFTGQYCAPPRYGPPSASQIPWLLSSFIPQAPPLYYGTPSPPYLQPPLHFDPKSFTNLISRPRGHHLNRTQLVEEHAPVEQAADGGMHLVFFLFDISIIINSEV
jgi:hypothetical protein